MGKAAKEASELVDIDPNKNEKTREQLLNGSGRISQRTKTPSGEQTSLDEDSFLLYNAESNSCKKKKKKKRKKRHNLLQNNVVDHGLPEDASMEKSLLETIDGSLKTSSEMTQLAGLSSKEASELVDIDPNKTEKMREQLLNGSGGISQRTKTPPGMQTSLDKDSCLLYNAESNSCKKKKKKKRKKKRHNLLQNNVVDHDLPEDASMKNSPLETIDGCLKTSSEMTQLAGLSSKEASELVDIDPNKNEKMREQLLNGSGGISQRTKTPLGKQTSLDKDSCLLYDAESNSSKKKRKKKRKHNLLQNNVVDHDLPEDASMKNSPLETIDGSLKTSLETTQLAGLSSKEASALVDIDPNKNEKMREQLLNGSGGISQRTKTPLGRQTSLDKDSCLLYNAESNSCKKKRKKKGKHNLLQNNVVDHDLPEDASMKNSPLETIDGSLKTSSETTQLAGLSSKEASELVDIDPNKNEKTREQLLNGSGGISQRAKTPLGRQTSLDKDSCLLYNAESNSCKKKRKKKGKHNLLQNNVVDHDLPEDASMKNSPLETIDGSLKTSSETTQLAGLSSKEASELVDIDPNKNEKTREQLLNGSGGISQRAKTPLGRQTSLDKDSCLLYNAESNSCTKKRKKKRKHNLLQNNVVDHDLPEDASMKNSPLETINGSLKTSSETTQLAGSSSKEASELVDIDPNKNEKTREQLLNGSGGISLYNAESNSCKKKRKKRKHNLLQNNVVDHDLPEDASMKNSPLETIDGSLKTSSETTQLAGSSSKEALELVDIDPNKNEKTREQLLNGSGGISLYNAESNSCKKKRKKRKHNLLQNNVVDHDLPEDASMKNSPLETIDGSLKTSSETTQLAGSSSKEASELVDIDPNKNEKTREQLLNGSGGISLYNAESNSCKKKRKKKGKHNLLQNNVVDHDLPEDASMKNSPLETVDGSLKTSLEMTQLAGSSSKEASELVDIDPNTNEKKKKSKNKMRMGRQNSLKHKFTHHDNPGCTSSIENAPLERGSFAQSPVNTCIKADSKIKQYDAEVNLSEGMNEGKEQNKRHNTPESNNISHDFQEGGGRPSLDSTDIKSFKKVDVSPILAVSEQVNTSPRYEDTSSTRKHDDHAGAGVIKVYKRKKQVQTYSRKRSKASNILEDSLKSIEEGVGSSLQVVQNNMGDISLDCSDEALTSGALENTAKREVIAGHGTSLQVVDNNFIEKKASGGCSYGEPADEESKKIDEMETEQVNRSKIDVSENAVQDIYSVEENFNVSSSFKEEKDLVDASGSDLSDEHLAKNVLEIQPKMEDAVSLSLVAIKDDASLVINKEECSLQVVQSSPGRALAGCFRRKLLILDVNGLLADILPYASDGYHRDPIIAKKPDTIIANKPVYKRPFCDDFLQFCFERFNVGVWTSRTKRNMESVLYFLMGKTMRNLLFCWDQAHCTKTGYNTVENDKKPLLLKELKKLWKKHESNLPWERGDYNESNTLLLDDSPYKALCNPPNTAVFPNTYEHTDEKDNSLGPGGDLRVYLERLALAENVQKFVEQNPFGQRPITERNPSWAFYVKVIDSVLSQSKDDATNSSAC
ncbi:hypothetical protein F0562_023710 [Nyssa sinensis]|uniref:FCP1 homology domain-containing protein n=1 Tax=Nyssa sinensis TaxID=561372 RepID=A0A5J5BIU4_9ASTE|nr:hypothetical protein F0562_023710 [Nyssa sinensis]